MCEQEWLSPGSRRWVSTAAMEPGLMVEIPTQPSVPTFDPVIGYTTDTDGWDYDVLD